MRRGDGHADLSYVFAAVEELAPHLDGFTVIATKSTVPVGTSREIERRLRALRPDGNYAVCSNPEFLREGSAIQDFTHPDRVLVGTDEPRAQELMERLYKPLAIRNAPVMFVSRESAELAKYAANAFLAAKISFINEVADSARRWAPTCRRWRARSAATVASATVPASGPGLRWLVLSQDVSALIRTAREHKSPISLIEQVQRVNDERKIAMAGRVEKAANGTWLRARPCSASASPSSPTPTTCVTRRASSSCPCCRSAAPPSGSFDPQGRKHAEALLPGVVWCK